MESIFLLGVTRSVLSDFMDLNLMKQSLSWKESELPDILKGNVMANAYVEYRPLSSDQTHGVTHHVVIVDGKEYGPYITQLEAEKVACKAGYTVHVARQRHLQDKPNPAHWRKSDC